MIGKQPQAGAAVVGDSSQRLIDLMGYGRRQLAHGCQPGHTRKLRLRYLQRFLCFLAWRDIFDDRKPKRRRTSHPWNESHVGAHPH